MYSSKRNSRPNICRGFLSWKRSRQSENESDVPKSKLALSAFVNGLIAFHQETSKESDDGKCSHDGLHRCLYLALRQCYELQLRSRKIVSRLIREIYLCVGNLNAIFSAFSFHVTNPVVDSERWMCLTGDCLSLYMDKNRKGVEFNEEVTRALAYYVKNIVPLPEDPRERLFGLRYSIRSVLGRPVDVNDSITPLMASAVLRDPNLIMLFLRHGADPVAKMKKGEYPEKDPINHIIDVLNSIAAVKGLRKVRQDSHCIQDLALEEQTALTCLEYCLRAIPHIHIEETSKYWHEERERNHYTVHSKLAHTLDLQRFKTPVSLKHLARCVIRSSILRAEKDSLPESIAVLPLPTTLKQYLDLCL